MAIMLDGGLEGLLYDDNAASAFGASKGNYDFINKKHVDDNVEDFNWIVKDAEAYTIDGSDYRITVYDKKVVVPSIHTNLPDGEYSGDMIETKWAYIEPSKYRVNNGRGRDNLKHWTIIDDEDRVPSYCPHHKIFVAKQEYHTQIHRERILNKILEV